MKDSKVPAGLKRLVRRDPVPRLLAGENWLRTLLADLARQA